MSEKYNLPSVCYGKASAIHRFFCSLSKENIAEIKAFLVKYLHFSSCFATLEKCLHRFGVSFVMKNEGLYPEDFRVLSRLNLVPFRERFEAPSRFHTASS